MLINVFSFILALVPSTLLQLLVAVMVLPVALTFTILSLIALRYTGLLVWNVISDYFRIGRFGQMPRPQHKGTWLQMLYGDMGRVLALEPAEAHRQFVQEAESEVLVYRHLAWAPRLLLADVGAMLFILGAQNVYSFPKPNFSRNLLLRTAGAGILIVEGNKHKSQRKILQPAFNTAVVRGLVPSFFHHARRLVDQFGRVVDAVQDPNNKTLYLGQKSVENNKLRDVFNVNAWIARCTLDIIGDTGFDWQFDSICTHDEDRSAAPRKADRLSDAFQQILVPWRPSSAFELALMVIRDQPFLNWTKCFRLPAEVKIDSNMEVIKEMSQEIIDTKRRQIHEMMAIDGNEKSQLSKSDWAEDGFNVTGGKDLLFHMMRSNLSADLADSERMTDAELLGQMTTLLLAGHETTATLLTWTLLMLAENPKVQIKLRNELRAWVEEAGRDELTYEELTQLPYLDAVIKEVLRVRNPVPAAMRQAEHDTAIPLSRPIPKNDASGYIDHVLIRKGEQLVLPLLLINTSETLWGPDALAFRPERWFDVPQPTKKSGMPLHLMSFISGPRACIGNRFALAEAKALLITLILAFEFSPVEGNHIAAKQAVVMRAFVKEQASEGFQLPLHVRRVAQAT